MGITLDQTEIHDFLESAHTGILTTLRRDGFPVSLPTWFITLDGRIYVNTPSSSKKIERIRNDPRANFLVESGLRWTELKAVMFYGKLLEVEDAALQERVQSTIQVKYQNYRMERKSQPKSSRRRYAQGTLLCFEPIGDPISWDNAKLRLPSRVAKSRL